METDGTIIEHPRIILDYFKGCHPSCKSLLLGPFANVTTPKAPQNPLFDTPRLQPSKTPFVFTPQALPTNPPKTHPKHPPPPLALAPRFRLPSCAQVRDALTRVLAGRSDVSETFVIGGQAAYKEALEMDACVRDSWLLWLLSFFFFFLCPYFLKKKKWHDFVVWKIVYEILLFKWAICRHSMIFVDMITVFCDDEYFFPIGIPSLQKRLCLGSFDVLSLIPEG